MCASMAATKHCARRCGTCCWPCWAPCSTCWGPCCCTAVMLVARLRPEPVVFRRSADDNGFARQDGTVPAAHVVAAGARRWVIVIQSGGILTSSDVLLVLADAFVPVDGPVALVARAPRISETAALALALCSLLLRACSLGTRISRSRVSHCRIRSRSRRSRSRSGRSSPALCWRSCWGAGRIRRPSGTSSSRCSARLDAPALPWAG